ncbi:MAG: signal peptide peptidase SppA [Persicimonas sp.]
MLENIGCWLCDRQIKLLVLVAATGILALPASVEAQQSERSPTEGLLIPDASLTTRDDATSLELNPAGLGFMDTAEAAVGLHRATADRRGRDPEGVGGFLATGNGAFGMGFAAQWLDRPGFAYHEAVNDYRKYTLGAALSGGSDLSLGLAYNFFGSGDSQSLDDLSSWDAGIQWRPSEIWGFGFHARDFNQPFVSEDESLPIRTGIGTAFRFFDGRAILDSTATYDSRGDWLGVTPRLLVEPVDGVRLFTRADFDIPLRDQSSGEGWNQTLFGLALNTNNFGVESAAHLDQSGENAEFSGQSHLAWISGDKRRSVAEPTGRWVLIDLTEEIQERPISQVLGGSTPSFLSVMHKLQEMADDPTIEGVVFNIGDSEFGYGQAWELRQAIQELGEAGKTTVGLLNNPTYRKAHRETYLASAAQHVWLLPTTQYAPQGMSVTLTSYAEALANAGIRAEFLRIGDYKSAPEAYTRREPTPESIEQTESYLDNMYERTVRALADDRGLETDEVKETVDHVPLYPEEAIEEGYIDEPVYPDQLDDRLQSGLNASARLQEGYEVSRRAEDRWGSAPEVAVVVVDGTIIRGESGQMPLIGEMVSGSDTLSEVIDQLRRDPGVKAVVVRVDSSGGDAIASDLIYRELRGLARHKPVVASMGNVAASGGYYVAAGADEIFATPNTLTGSIGIFTGKFSISKLSEFIGIGSTQLKRGERAGQSDMYRPWTEEQREGIAEGINYLYHLFIQQVARTRPLDAEEVDEVGRGHIWDGEQAKERKLVDEVGSLTDAIERAESLAGIEPGEADYEVYPDPLRLVEGGTTPLVQRVAGQIFGEQVVGPHATPSSPLARLLEDLGRGILLPALFEDGQSLALLPYVVSVE